MQEIVDPVVSAEVRMYSHPRRGRESLPRVYQNVQAPQNELQVDILLRAMTFRSQVNPGAK